MARRRLDYLSSIFTDDYNGISAYQGLLSNSFPVTIKEQLFPSLSAANSAIQEGMRICAISHNAVSKVHDCFLDMCEDGRYKAVTVLEQLISGVEGKEWSEWELISLLRALISALNTAERQGIALETVNPRALFQTSAGVKLFPSFGYMDAAYYSPERKQSQSPYNPFKSDVYSLGLTVLSLALGERKLESVERDPRPLLEGLGGTLGQLLGWLLMGVEERPGFAQLEEYFQTNAGYFDKPTNSYAAVEEQKLVEEQKSVIEQKTVETAPKEEKEAVPITQIKPVPAEIPAPTQAPASAIQPKPNTEAKRKPTKAVPPCLVEERKEEKPTPPPQERQCPVCFSAFIPPKKHPDSLYCSKKCKDNRALRAPSPPSNQSASLSVSKCDYCPAELNTTEKQELSCGHSFHSLDCLFTFLVAKSDNFTNKGNYFCPKCNKRIKYRKEIEEVFGKSALQKRMDAARCALLCSQCQAAPFAYERRGKLLCAACSGQ